VTTDLKSSAEVIEWVRKYAPPSLPEDVLPTLAAYVLRTDETGRGAHPTLSAVAAELGVSVRKVSRGLAVLKDAGLLVVAEPTDPEVLALPVHERPKVYDLGGLLRTALLGPEREDPDPRGVAADGGGAAEETELPDKVLHGVAWGQNFPRAVDYLGADLVVRELNQRGARLYAEQFQRMYRLVAQGLANGWDEKDLLQTLDKGLRSIFVAEDYLLHLMERNLTPPPPPDILYRQEQVPAARIPEWTQRIIVSLNRPRHVLDFDQVQAARPLITTVLAEGMTSMDLMLHLEEVTTWPNPGSEILARLRKLAPGQPYQPASPGPRPDQGPTQAQLDRRALGEALARVHRITLDRDQARILDNHLRIALLNGWSHPDLFAIAVRPLDRLDVPEVELVERYRGLGAKL